MTCYDIWKLVLDGVATVFIPFVIYLISKNATDAIKNREINTKYVEFAITVLSGEAIEENKVLEKWAKNVIKKFSPIPLPEDIVIKAKTAELNVSIGDIEIDAKGHSKNN